MRVISAVYEKQLNMVELGMVTAWVIEINGQVLSSAMRQPTRDDVENLVFLFEEDHRPPKRTR